MSGNSCRPHAHRSSSKAREPQLQGKGDAGVMNSAAHTWCPTNRSPTAAGADSTRA